MGGGWRVNEIQLSSIILMILLLEYQGCVSLNSEGSSLIIFRDGVDSDPYRSFANWNSSDADPCMWSGVHCLGTKVHTLNLSGFSLKGELAPELGNLTHLRSLVLSNNKFSGDIPKTLGLLTMLEVLDLRYNKLTGKIPGEIGDLKSLKCLLLSNNNFEGTIPPEIGNLKFLSKLQLDENLVPGVQGEIGRVNRKFGHGFSFAYDSVPTDRKTLIKIIQPVQTTDGSARRRLVAQSNNLAAAPVKQDHVISLPSSRSSGSFPAVPKDLLQPTSPRPPKDHSPDTKAWPRDTNNGHSEDKNPGNAWKYIIGISSGIVLISVAMAMLIICKGRAAKTIGPWKSGLSGQLQKAFVTGVPKLNHLELEQACEDFSNIICTYDAYTVYKGTLSSGVEIAVISTALTSLVDWTRRSEMAFRKKIATLSRVNHKNFVNLIGFCEEDEPFVRMMVFEYAPNGTLYEHLHVKEVEHLDWSARMRIIMGTAYCLQYMHELKPSVPHSNLNSHAISLTDDYAAKVGEISFWSEFMSNSKKKRDSSNSDHCDLATLPDEETNIYCFGLLLLEIISGKLPHSDEEGSLLNWATQYLNDESISCLIDPTLSSLNDNELDIICEVIKQCIQADERKRPTMQETVFKLREVIDISPDSATPRLSPLWWAELEILSAEAN
ncbi:hypothetical protein Leryth_026885 [Lithospermum erythrorhizon]|nr:hypothetical protein Leryth_026885 [Lithospermum erythrorhizon]